MHQTLTGVVFGYGIAIFGLAFYVFFVKRKENHAKQNLEVMCEKAGIIIICVCVVIDFARYLMNDVMDRAFFIRLGLLLGVAYCDKISKETIEQAEKEADQNMYENKLEMKKNAFSNSL